MKWLRAALHRRRDKYDVGPLENVGWGPFAWPGERKRLAAAEARRLEKIRRLSGDG